MAQSPSQPRATMVRTIVRTMAPHPRTVPFVRYHRHYDDWFEHHRAACVSELLAVRAALPSDGRGLEVGVGTGRLARPLGVEFGIDPASEMLSYARARGAHVAVAVAEALPFADASFDYVLIVTTICFVDDAHAMLREARRVLLTGGEVVIGLIDRESPLGQHYLAHQAQNVFYRDARFYSAVEVEELLGDAGFADLIWLQSLSVPLSQIREIESVATGAGHGVFLVVYGRAQRRDGGRGAQNALSRFLEARVGIEPA